MRVIHLIGGGDVGGAKTHVLSLVAQLTKHIEVLLVSLRAGEFAEDAKAMGIPVEVVHNGNPLKDIAQLKSIVQNGGYDLVHCHGSKANVMGALISRSCKKPVVTTVHSDYRLDYMGNFIKQHTFGLLNTIALRFLNGYIGVTDNFADMLIERGFDPYHVHVIYNGLDFNVESNPKMSREEYLTSLGLSFDKDTVVCGIAARLHPVKDIGTILRAFAKIQDSCPNIRLIIGGDGEQMEYLKDLARELNLTGCVVLPGWISDMDTFLNAININLLSSLSESFPYSVLEAVRARCTMVCSAVGGMPILIDHGANGLLFKPQDVDTLAEHLRYLYEHPPERAEMADKLLAKARALYSLDKMVQDQLGIYDAVLRGREKERDRRGQVTICGSYGRGNAGDDAILKAVAGEIHGIDPDARICVMSRNPKQTKLDYRVRSIYTFNIFKMIYAMRQSHLYVNGGGSLIQDSTSSRSLYFYLFTLRMAHLLHCKVMMYGCGIGPVRKHFNRKLAAYIIDHSVDTITLRDPNSKEELEDMKVKGPDMILAADPTLNLIPANDTLVQSAFFREGLVADGKYICFAMRKWKNINKKIPQIAKAADYAAKHHKLTPVFISMEHERDLPIANEIAACMKSEAIVISGHYDVHTVIGILSKMQLIVAMRLHALVFGAGQGVPVIGIAYDDKVDGFMDYIGRELCTPYDTFDFNTLKEYIDVAIGSETMSQKLRESTRIIRENERANSCAAKEFFKHE